MIQVSRPYLPSQKKFQKYCEGIWQNHHLTNFGPLSLKLEERLCEYLGLDHILLLANGTLALQIAYKIAGLKAGDAVITTPFSFVATTNTLLWEGLEPIFCDIDSKSFCMDKAGLEACIKDAQDPKALLPVHVFGNPCEVEFLESIAKQTGLKLIYDAAHAFGVNYKGKSVLGFGDIATLSFHATKIFHTTEGGALILREKEAMDEARSLINFGLKENMPSRLGINAKLSEFHAAMGLCVLDDMPFILEERARLWRRYAEGLGGLFDMQAWQEDSTNNHHYFPLLFKNEKALLDSVKKLNQNGIFPRRYFYPSLAALPFSQQKANCPVALDIANRILCLPLFVGLDEKCQEKIIELLSRNA